MYVEYLLFSVYYRMQVSQLNQGREMSQMKQQKGSKGKTCPSCHKLLYMYDFQLGHLSNLCAMLFVILMK